MSKPLYGHYSTPPAPTPDSLRLAEERDDKIRGADYMQEYLWQHYGWSVTDEADRLIEAERAVHEQDPHYYARLRAAGMAAVLLNMIGSTRATPAERMGMRLQARWWRDVAEEISERELA
jgi:hypothetical protein